MLRTEMLETGENMHDTEHRHIYIYIYIEEKSIQVV